MSAKAELDFRKALEDRIELEVYAHINRVEEIYNPKATLPSFDVTRDDFVTMVITPYMPLSQIIKFLENQRSNTV